MTLRLDEDQSLLYLCGTDWDRHAIREYVELELGVWRVTEVVEVLLSENLGIAFYVDPTGEML